MIMNWVSEPRVQRLIILGERRLGVVISSSLLKNSRGLVKLLVRSVVFRF